MPQYEYTRATWDEVVKFGPQGWRLVQIPPFAEVKQGLAGPQMGDLLYTMEREVAADRKPEDAAERMRRGLGPIARTFVPDSR